MNKIMQIWIMILYKSKKLVIFWYKGLEIAKYQVSKEYDSHGYISKNLGYTVSLLNDDIDLLYNNFIEWLKEEILN